MKRMIVQIFFSLTLCTIISSCASHMAPVVRGNIDFIKTQDSINVEYDYSEIVYLKNSSWLWGDGEKLEGAKYLQYLVQGQSEFESFLNREFNAGEQPRIRAGFTDAKYTLIMKPTLMNFGDGTAGGCKFEVTILFVETKNPSKVLAEISTWNVNHGKKHRDRIILGMKGIASMLSIYHI